MTTRVNMLVGFLVVAAGAQSLQAGSPSAAEKAGAFACPRSICVSICPEDEQQACEGWGCSTSTTTCMPLGNCDNPGGGVLYCGSEPEQ